MTFVDSWDQSDLESLSRDLRWPTEIKGGILEGGLWN